MTEIFLHLPKRQTLLFYLRDSNIHSADDFRKAVSDAEAKIENLKLEKSELAQKIADTEKIIDEIPKYLEILNRRPLLPRDISELAKYNYLEDAGVSSLDDADKQRLILADMKSRLEEADEKICKAIFHFYTAYENQMKSDYQVLLEQAKAEIENIRRE